MPEGPRCSALPAADKTEHKRVQRSTDAKERHDAGRCRAPQTELVCILLRRSKIEVLPPSSWRQATVHSTDDS